MLNLLYIIINKANAQGDVSLENPVVGDDLVSVLERIAGYLVPIAGMIFLIMLVYGGILYITSQGNEAQSEKAKNSLIWALIGIIIVALAWAIEAYVRENLPF